MGRSLESRARETGHTVQPPLYREITARYLAAKEILFPNDAVAELGESHPFSINRPAVYLKKATRNAPVSYAVSEVMARPIRT